jgi:hypothetical protein
LASDPPPLAATVTSTVAPFTSSTLTTAGVLSLVFFALARRIGQHRSPQLVVRVEIRAPHALVHHLLQVLRLSPGAASKRTSMPTFRNAVTIPVSWQMGRCPSAHMRLLIRICAIASFAAGDSSRSYALARLVM